MISEQESEERGSEPGANWGKGIEALSVTYKALEQRCVWDVWETQAAAKWARGSHDRSEVKPGVGSHHMDSQRLL